MKRDRLIKFINAIQTIRNMIDDDVAITVSALYPQWQEGINYQVGDRVFYNETLYKCLQSHTSQSTWTPTEAHSLWSQVLIPDTDVIPDWVQPDSTNPYMKGDKVKFNGKTYESTVDNNVWQPDVYGWEQIE